MLGMVDSPSDIDQATKLRTARRAYLLVLLAVGIGFAYLLQLEGTVMWWWMILGFVGGLGAELWFTFDIVPESVGRQARAVVFFAVGALMLWIVFERQPSMVVYASGSVGVAAGLFLGRALWMLLEE